MGLFNFGKSKNFLAVVTSEGPGRMRINGVHVTDAGVKKSAAGHERTICWIEFAPDGVRVDQGVGRASGGTGVAERLLRDLPTMPITRTVLDHLRTSTESIGKWLQIRDPAAAGSPTQSGR